MASPVSPRSRHSIKAAHPHNPDMSSSTPHPRRRAARSHASSSMAPPDSAPCNVQTRNMTLRKGLTFNSPTSPSSPVDPVLSIPSLPHRSPTCPKALEALVAANEKRVADLIDSCFASPLASAADHDDSHKEPLPVPKFMLAHLTADLDALALDKKIKVDDAQAKARPAHHRHSSDSGLGSSISDRSNAPSTRLRLKLRTTRASRSLPSANNQQGTNGLASTSAALSTDSVYSSSTTATAINKSFSSATSVQGGHYLSEYATQQIKKYIVHPILKEETLKDFHPLIKDIPYRISDRAITCLRDLEKTLIFLAPARSRSATSYLNFCETSIQCIHTTVDHLNEIDQRRPTDRPYTNNYFLDLVEQVRQYARIMAATRQKQEAGEELTEMDYSSNEKIIIQGGLSQNGKPAELVREKDGKLIPIDAGEAALKRTSSNMSIDDDVTRSMARRRKCDIGKIEIHPCLECGKEFKRPCDLTKHTKTHSRPFKCHEPTCKYHELGWPTEKECERHQNDKHSDSPPTYKCHFENCTYTSKRESNCKQHMEKSHGWEYVRSKSKNNKSKAATGSTPQTPLMPTPASGNAFPRLSTPMTPFAPSPSEYTNTTYSRDGSVGAGPSNTYHGYGHADAFDMNAFTSSADNNVFDFNDLTQKIPGSAAPFTPALSVGHTPDSILTQSPDDLFQPTAFDETFGVFDTSAYPPVGDFFPQYNMQQPTPAMSDFEFLKNPVMDVIDTANTTSPELSPNDQGDLELFEHINGHQDPLYQVQGNDFTLYGEIPGPNTTSGTMIPDLSYDSTSQGQMDMSMYDASLDFTMFPSWQN